MINEYYFKVENNVELFWRIRRITDNPFKENEIIAEFFVGNVKQYIGRTLRSKEDLERYDFLTGYSKISNSKDYHSFPIIDDELGLLRLDGKFKEVFAYRRISGINKICKVEFSHTTSFNDIRNIFKLAINLNDKYSSLILETAYDYFLERGKTDEYYRHKSIASIEDFIPTIELNYVSLNYDEEKDSVLYYFRPSWDEEHGLYIIFDFTKYECRVI